MDDNDKRLAEIRQRCEAPTFQYAGIGLNDAKYLLCHLAAWQRAVEAYRPRPASNQVDRHVDSILTGIIARQRQLAGEIKGNESLDSPRRRREMILVEKSPTADTRTCDFAKVTKEQLRSSSMQHIHDVTKALRFFDDQIGIAALAHDTDKLTDLDSFHDDFVTGFKQTGWWDRHRKLNRHHLNMADGIPADVNLIDVLDYIADCVMAGMARSGSVYELKLPPELLESAFQNTVKLLKEQVVVR